MSDHDPDTATARPVNPGSHREVFAWSFYDFANSGYTTVVLTTIYSAYFVSVIAAEADARSPGTATLLWTLGIGLANLVVLLSGPVMGAIADYRASKKRFLLLTTVCCVMATAALGFSPPGQVTIALALLVLSAIAFSLGENLIASFLPEIAHSERMGRVSGYGWSVGYLGGLITLGICLAYINRATARGESAVDYVPVTLFLTALIFAVTAVPTFLWLKERARPRPLPPGQSFVGAGFDRVRLTLSHAAQLTDLFRFLCCLTLYQSGVATVVVISAIYAQQVMGFDSQQLIVLIMVVNVTAALGAFAFGYAQDHFGSIPSLAAGLLVWVIAITLILFAESPSDLWLAGNLIGLALGATQAGGRALIAQFTPEARSAEIFGLWGLAGRASAIIGPLSYGVISRVSGGDHRVAILSTLVFFLLGLMVLFTVDEQRGRRARHAIVVSEAI
jgi:UMF1 family MFS transporter